MFLKVFDDWGWMFYEDVMEALLMGVIEMVAKPEEHVLIGEDQIGQTGCVILIKITTRHVYKAAEGFQQ